MLDLDAGMAFPLRIGEPELALVVVGGDITSSAQPSEFSAAHKVLGAHMPFCSTVPTVYLADEDLDRPA